VEPQKWQRNAMFEAVAAGGLDAREYTLQYDDMEASIIHVPSASFFLLEGEAGHYTTTAVVGEMPTLGQLDAYTWAKVEERVRRWAEDVKRDDETPDLWAELQRERKILAGACYEDVENTPFTSDEQAEIAEQLRQIKEYAKKTYSLTQAQMLSLNARFDELEAAAGRIGRKDWLLLFLGVMFTVIVTDLLPPEAVQHILGMALQGLDHLFGGWGRPPQLQPIT
jgi:hypothetical protein